MNVEYINPIIETSQRIIKEITELDTSLGKVYVKKSPYETEGIAVIIGITGKIKGQAVFSTNKNLASKIACSMLGAFITDISDLDEMAESAFAEMANIIMGNYLSLLPKKNFAVDITPPTIILAKNISFSCSKQVILCIPLIFLDGEILEIHVSFVEFE